MSSKGDQIRKRVYAAALLHDIGKFSQRADADAKILPEHWQGNEGIFCPVHPEKGYFTHRHVLYTAAFIEKWGLQSFYGEKEDEDNLLRLAAAHHKPSTPLQELIQRADWYASGMDRSSHIAFKDAELEYDRARYRKTRMCSIFELLGRPDMESEAWKYRLPLHALTLGRSVFPQKKEEFEADPDYAGLWKDFETEVAKLDSDHPDSFIGSLYYQMARFTQAIPSTTMHLPDVSLFDHSKITAAFALSLYDYQKSQNRLGENWQAPDNEESPFLLFGGDLSGIQKYIYGIISKYAAKNLKGRSFYLEFLSDAVIREILKECNLYEANVIYSSGGRFYLLLPNTEEVIQKTEDLRDRLEEKIFEKHGLRLYLAMAHIPLKVSTIMNDVQSSENISGAWRQLSEKLNEQKRQRYKKRILQDATFFEAKGKGGEARRDALTGEELQGEGKLLKGGAEGEIRVNAFTEKLIELGRSLKEVDYWVVAPEAIAYWENDKGIQSLNLFDDSYHHYFLSAETLARVKERLRGSVDDVFLRSFNRLEYQTDIRGRSIVQGFTLYAGNDFPVVKAEEMMNPEIASEAEEGDPKTFDMLAKKGNFNKLGVLRMDVDGLGQIFINGIPEKMRTFSRYATLSRSLDFYFKGYLNTLWADGRSAGQAPFRDHTFIIYAGGDDLFIVGYWADIIDLAEAIYMDFRAFTCHNPHLTLSGGMALVAPKYPIYRAAEEAAEEEELAKEHRWPWEEEHCDAQISGIKDSFSFLSRPLHWSEEWPEVKRLADRLRVLTGEEKKLPRGLLHRLQLYAEEARKDAKARAPGRWRWIMSYDLKRMSDRVKKDEDAIGFLQEIQKNVLTESVDGKPLQTCYPYLDLLQLAARWAEFLTK